MKEMQGLEKGERDLSAQIDQFHFAYRQAKKT